jgi:hypothetical protein
MAQLLLSEIGIRDIRGRIAGTQFTRVRSGNQAIRPTIPREPFSGYQNTSNRNFRAVLAEWMGLNNTERTSWETAAATGDWERLNRVGEPYNPTGQSLFIELNLNAYTESFPIRTAPALPTFTTVSVTGGVATTAPAVGITFSTGTIAAGETMVIYTTKSLSPGRTSSIQQQYAELARVQEPSFTTTVNINAAFQARWGLPVLDCVIFMRAELMNTASGARTDVGWARVLITA